MFEHFQPSKSEDLHCLMGKIKVINDIISYNVTCQLDAKYNVWIDRHQDLIEELEFMIKEDLIRNEVDN